MTGVEIHGIDSVRLLAEKFGKMPEDLSRQLKPKLLEAGRIVQHQAQANASWSTRIPGATKVTASVTRNGGALIRVDSKAAPHARPYEGASGRGDTFRHPVFGNTDVWVTEGTRPFLFPARKSKQAEAMASIAAAVKSATSI